MSGFWFLEARSKCYGLWITSYGKGWMVRGSRRIEVPRFIAEGQRGRGGRVVEGRGILKGMTRMGQRVRCGCSGFGKVEEVCIRNKVYSIETVLLFRMNGLGIHRGGAERQRSQSERGGVRNK